MRLDGLMTPLQESDEFKKTQSKIKDSRFPIGVTGLSESGKSYFINAVYNENSRSIVVVTHSDIEARNIYEDLSLYINDVYYFPAKEVVFYNIDAISGDLRWARLKVLNEMFTNSAKKVVVTSIESFVNNYIPVEMIKSHIFTVSVGQCVDFNNITQTLMECGYERMEIVDGKGQFSLRGGILDIYPPTSALPYRIELFGDEVDSIRTFNVESQRSIEKVKECNIFPAKEMILDEESIKEAVRKMNDQMEEYIASKGKSETEAINRITSTIKENID